MPLTPDQQELYDFMSEISESSYCAGWMEGTEYRLWAFMIDPADDGDWGMWPIPEEARAKLRDLSDRIGGWTYFDWKRDRPGSGEIFVRREEWLKAFDRWKAGQA